MAENMQHIWMEQPYTEEKTDPTVKCRKMVHVKGMLLCHNQQWEVQFFWREEMQQYVYTANWFTAGLQENMMIS
jgi:hypothetical protein